LAKRTEKKKTRSWVEKSRKKRGGARTITTGKESEEQNKSLQKVLKEWGGGHTLKKAFKKKRGFRWGKDLEG